MMFWMTLAMASPPDAEALRDTMASHWTSGVELRDAVIQGDVSAVRRVAKGFLDGSTEPALVADAADRLRPFLSALERVQTIDAAAHQVSLLARACGSCHAEQGVKRSFVPTEGLESPTSVMDRHALGAASMWAGIIAKDDAQFQAGAAMFSVPGKGWSSTPHALAIPLRRARTAAGALRAGAYGDLLSACAGCHQSAMRLPPPEIFVAEMHDRVRLLEDVKEAVIAGKRRVWQAKASELSSLDRPDQVVSGPWAPWMEQLQLIAWRLEAETDRGRAGELVGTLAMHCGACHMAIGEGPPVVREDEIDSSITGLDLLLNALLTGTDVGWQTGAEALHQPDLADVPVSGRAAAFGKLLAR